MDILEYFFECYFHMGEDYDDLDKIINDFKETEKKILYEKLRDEFFDIIKNNNYEKAASYLKQFGRREPPFAKTRILTIFIYKRLMDIPTSIIPEDFCDMKTLSKKALMERYDIFENPKDS